MAQPSGNYRGPATLRRSENAANGEADIKLDFLQDGTFPEQGWTLADGTFTSDDKEALKKMSEGRLVAANKPSCELRFTDENGEARVASAFAIHTADPRLVEIQSPDRQRLLRARH